MCIYFTSSVGQLAHESEPDPPQLVLRLAELKAWPSGLASTKQLQTAAAWSAVRRSPVVPAALSAAYEPTEPAKGWAFAAQAACPGFAAHRQ